MARADVTAMNTMNTTTAPVGMVSSGGEAEEQREHPDLEQRKRQADRNTISKLPSTTSTPSDGTVTLIEKCSGAVEFETVATEHRWVVHISGGSIGRGDLTPDREAVGHLGSPFGRAEQMPSRPEACGD